MMRTLHAVLLALLALVGTAFSAERPNVIFVMPDDISHNAFSYYNPVGPRTPHIDGLARQSIRLTDFHVSPTCAPTRASLMTGRFNAVAGVWHTIYQRNQLRADEITMADVFRHNGYATGLFFKWHLGDNYPFRPKDRGFDHVAWTKAGGVGQTPDYWGNMNTRATVRVNDELVEMTDEDDGIEGAFTTNFFFNRAMEWIESNVQMSSPFFAYIPTATAHDPHHFPPDAREGVDAKSATVENIDKNMGRLLRFLDEKGIAENTILVFTTDNGSSTFLRGGKGSRYDGGSRVPCFIRWPAGGLGGPGRGRDVTPLTAHIDWLPTFMDLLGFEDVPGRPEKLKLHGQSFKTFLDTDPDNDPGPKFKNRAIVIENMRTEHAEKFRSFSVKKDVWSGNGIARKWRLVRGSARGDWELYDVLLDEDQSENLIGNPAHAPVIADLQAEYENYWTLVAERSDEYTRIILGHPAEPETLLTSHDFHGVYLWNHAIVAEGKTGSGFIAVEFAKAGTYQFDLRRWPKEIEDQSTLTTAPEGVVYDGRTVPQAIDIASARIKIWNGGKVYVDQKRDAEPGADGIPFTTGNLPAGPAFIQTWFYNSAGEPEGAVYYNYARPM
ncbi:MAG TPA: sulfatase [Verrucomicrobiales bacterium]|nr:sulfatase [Verrucomicrobiales bacterium]